MSEIDLVAAAVTRLKEQVTDFQSRVDDAAELAALIEARKLPQNFPAAFVLPLGDDGQPAKSMTGAQREKIIESFAVIIIAKKQGDAGGSAGRATVTDLRTKVRNAFAGWAPGESYTGTQYRRSRLLAMTAGAVFLQAEFSTVLTHTATS